MEKKRSVCNIYKNGSNINIFKHKKIRKTDISCFTNDGTACYENSQMKNNQESELNVEFQTINRNIIDIPHLCFKKIYRMFQEKKDDRIFNNNFLQVRENHYKSENFLPCFKIPTKDFECYQKSLSLIESQLTKYMSPYDKSQFRTLQFHREIYPSFDQSYLTPIYNEFILSLSNCLGKQEDDFSIDCLRKESNVARFFPRHLAYSPQFISQTNVPFQINIQPSMPPTNHQSHLLSSIHNLVPSCNKCLLPGFHSITAWLLPPTYFEKGRLKQSYWFLNGMPANLLNTCFSVKNILTVESTYLFASKSNKEEFEHYKKENFFLKEEICKESIYYFDDFKENIGTEIDGTVHNKKQFKNEDNLTRNIDYFIQCPIFCGFINIEFGNERCLNSFVNLEEKSNVEFNTSSANIEIYSNQDTNIVININEKNCPIIGDCDIFSRSSHNFLSYWNKNVRQNQFEDKIPLLIPRIKCFIKETCAPYQNYMSVKPCYLLLWNYNIRNCKNTTKDINWINIQCRFAKLKYFGQAYENSVSINLSPHKEVVLDQLNRIRNVDEARIFAWILAGCMQYTIMELLMDSYTKSLFYKNEYFKTTNEINYFSNCIQNGPFYGFPDSPLDCNGEIKWNLLKELVEN